MGQPWNAEIDVPVSGGKLRVALAGAPPGPDVPVVLAIHGITSTSRAWSAVARHLGSDLALVAPDLRGRGESSTLPGPFGFPAHIADLLAVLDHLDVASAVVAGHSMGAFVATRLTADSPDGVAAVVLVDGGPPMPVPPDVDPDTLMAGVLGPTLTRLGMTFPSPAAHRQFWADHPAFAPARPWNEDITSYVDYDLGPAGEGTFRSRVVEEAVRADGRDILDRDAVSKALAVMACPATLVWAPRGLQDQPFPLLPAQAIAEAVQLAPQLAEIEIPDTNHYLMVLRDREAAVVAGEIRRLATS